MGTQVMNASVGSQPTNPVSQNSKNIGSYEESVHSTLEAKQTDLPEPQLIKLENQSMNMGIMLGNPAA